MSDPVKIQNTSINLYGRIDILDSVRSEQRVGFVVGRRIFRFLENSHANHEKNYRKTGQYPGKKCNIDFNKFYDNEKNRKFYRAFISATWCNFVIRVMKFPELIKFRRVVLIFDRRKTFKNNTTQCYCYRMRFRGTRPETDGYNITITIRI